MRAAQPFDVGEWHAPLVLLEQSAKHLGERALRDVVPPDQRAVDAAQGDRLGPGELDVRLDADRAEYSASHRAEVGLDELSVRVGVGQRGELGLDPAPQIYVVGKGAEHPLDRGGRGVDVFVVELDPLGRVASRAVPVALLEPLRRPLRDRPKLGVVGEKAIA